MEDESSPVAGPRADAFESLEPVVLKMVPLLRELLDGLEQRLLQEIRLLRGCATSRWHGIQSFQFTDSLPEQIPQDDKSKDFGRDDRSRTFSEVSDPFKAASTEIDARTPTIQSLASKVDSVWQNSSRPVSKGSTVINAAKYLHAADAGQDNKDDQVSSSSQHHKPATTSPLEADAPFSRQVSPPGQRSTTKQSSNSSGVFSLSAPHKNITNLPRRASQQWTAAFSAGQKPRRLSNASSAGTSWRVENSLMSLDQLTKQREEHMLKVGARRGHAAFKTHATPEQELTCTTRESPCNSRGTAAFKTHGIQEHEPTYTTRESQSDSPKYAKPKSPEFSASSSFTSGVSPPIAHDLSLYPVGQDLTLYGEAVFGGCRRSGQSLEPITSETDIGDMDQNLPNEALDDTGFDARAAILGMMSSLSSSPKNMNWRTSTLQSMREHRQEELLAVAYSKDATAFDSDRPYIGKYAPLWLYFSGILQWPASDGKTRCRCPTLLRLVVGLALTSIALFYCGWLFVLSGRGSMDETCHAQVCLQDTICPVMALAVGCILRLAALTLVNDQVVGHHDAVLTHFAFTVDVASQWRLNAKFDMMKLMLLWACIVAACICASRDWDLDSFVTFIHVAATAFTANVFLALAYSMLYICQGLSLVLDDFCHQVIQQGGWHNAVQDWNVLQAILRRGCTTVARSYIALLTSALASTFLPTLVFDRSLVAMLPGACALLVMLWVSLFIGGVTSKCDRVPAFMNTLDFHNDFDHERQYVVDYIINSRAGFYMFDVRVTGEMVVKCAYVGGVLVAAFTTRLLSRS